MINLPFMRSTRFSEPGKALFLFSFLTLLLASVPAITQDKVSRANGGDGTVMKEGTLVSVTPGKIHGSPRIKEDGYITLVKSRKQEYFSGKSKAETPPKFIDPVKLKEGIDDPGFYAISAYFDHDPVFPDSFLDYNCGGHTFDNPEGYNHGGTDYFPWPFPWRKMYQDEVEVIAAASGILIFKQDGYFDQHCELTGEPWNGLTILHDDGSTSWYIHLKKGSLTEKEINSEILAGEYLGIVGSSGNTFAPHLHFEVYNNLEQLIDPFEGQCNSTATETWWEDQLPYLEPGINKISTNSALPAFSDCPGEEIPNESNTFYPGDTIFLLSYFRNIFINDLVEVSIIRPDNSVFASWNWNSQWEYYTATWLYFYTLPGKEDQKGTWKYQLGFKGKTYSHSFQFLESQSVGKNPSGDFAIAYPNPASDNLVIRFNDTVPEGITIELWNIKGKKINTSSIYPNAKKEHTFNIEHLKPGVYILSVNIGPEIQNIKVVKK